MAKVPCIKLPALPRLPQIRFPAGFTFKVNIDPFDGGDLCNLNLNLLGQLNIGLAILAPIICILEVIIAGKNFIEALAQNPASIILPAFWTQSGEPGFELILIFSQCLAGLLPPIWVLQFLCDILNFILDLMECVLQMSENIVQALLQAGLTIALSIDLGLTDLDQTQICLIENASKNSEEVARSMDPIAPIFDLLQALLELIGLEDTLPELTLDPFPPDSDISEALEVQQENIDNIQAFISDVRSIVDAICQFV